MTKSVAGDVGGLLRSRGDRINHAMRVVCRPIFHVATRPMILHADRAERHGGFLLAANHHHAMDIPALMYATPRLVDFVSIPEVMGTRGIGLLYKQVRTITLNRGTVDPAAIRTIVGRLRAGRVVGIFPEARLTPPAKSVTSGGPHRPGLGRIARLAGVPILPTVVIDTHRLMSATAWLPLRRTRFAVAFGQPLEVRRDRPSREAQQEVEARWRAAIVELIEELRGAGHADVSPVKKPTD